MKTRISQEVFLKSIKKLELEKVKSDKQTLVLLKRVIYIWKIPLILLIHFFVTVASKIKEAIINSSHGKLRDFCNDRLPPEAKFNIPPIQKDQILKFLQNLDVGKATGTDNIGPRLLRYSAPYIVNEIAYICNQSIQPLHSRKSGKKQKSHLYSRRVLVKM